jgi:hypothetical protein
LPELFAFQDRERAIATFLGRSKRDDYRHRDRANDLSYSFDELWDFLLQQTISAKFDDVGNTSQPEPPLSPSQKSWSADGYAYECCVGIGGHRNRGDALDLN